MKNFFVLLGLIGFSFAFYFFPEVDLAVSAYFYNINGVFKDSEFTAFVDDSAKYVCVLVSLYLAYFSIRTLIKHRSINLKYYSNILFVALVIAIGPGIIIHPVLKDNWGRARPHQIEQFGGEKQFTQAFVHSKQCSTNCSFVSGHASVGFMFFAFAFLYQGRKRYLLNAFAICLGAVYGYARIYQGAHFLSDVVISGVITYLTAWALYEIMKPLSPISVESV